MGKKFPWVKKEVLALKKAFLGLVVDDFFDDFMIFL